MIVDRKRCNFYFTVFSHLSVAVMWMKRKQVMNEYDQISPPSFSLMERIHFCWLNEAAKQGMILQDKLEDYTIVQKARDLETGLVSEWWERRTPERLIPDSGTECLLRDPHWELSDLLKITQEVHRQINGLSVTSSHQQAEPWLSGDCWFTRDQPRAWVSRNTTVAPTTQHLLFPSALLSARH